MNKQLNEAVVRLKKNFLNQVKNRDDIYCGIEYEFHPNDIDTGGGYVHREEPDSEDDIYKLLRLLENDTELYLDDDAHDYMEGYTDTISGMSDLIDYLVNEDILYIDTSYTVETVNTYNFLIELLNNGYLDAEDTDEENSIIRSAIGGRDRDEFLSIELDSSGIASLYTQMLNNGIEIDDDFTYDEGLFNSTVYDVVDAINRDDESYTNIYKEHLRNILEDIPKIPKIKYEEIDIYDVDISKLSREVLHKILAQEDTNDYLYYNFDVIEVDSSDIDVHEEHNMEFDMAESIFNIQNELDIKHIDYRDVVADNNNQVEVISETMFVGDGILHIDEMFDFIEEHGFTSRFSGMHVSISSDKWKNVDFNILKFFVFMDMPDIINIFPKRKHVADLYRIFMYSSEVSNSIIHEIENNKSLTVAIANIQKYLDNNIGKIMGGKLQSIKFDDYNTLNGRIELRYFGGENYEYRYDEIEKKILEAVYVMELSYGELYNKEYQKGVLKLLNGFVNNIVQRYILSKRISTENVTPDIENINTLEQLHKLVHSDIFV